MLFNSIEFLLFLPVVFIIYWSLSRYLKVQNCFILLASYVFYGWWDWRFLFLIVAVSFIGFTGGKLIIASKNVKSAKMISAVSVILCLLILCVFKYFDFFSASLSRLVSLFGLNLSKVTLGLILPVGMSFYILQSVGYLIDTYRGYVKNDTSIYNPDIISYFTFIGFFPQLIAGPIERAGNLLVQFEKKRCFEYPRAVEGMQQILWGLFKKVAIADGCGRIVNNIFGNFQDFDGGMLAWGAIFFSFQIYCDFSGYSDIAIGTGRLLGIKLNRNFHYPFLSRNIAEMWRRWHISLNKWFVDYVYIPLGRSRGAIHLTVFNTLLIFFLSGLWHGAKMSFVVWGLFNAIIFIPLIVTGKTKKYKKGVVAENSRLPNIVEVVQILTTFFLFTIGVIFFRSNSVMEGWNYIKRMFTHFTFVFPEDYIFNIIAIAILIAVEWLQRRRDFGLQLSHNGILRYNLVRWAIYYLFCLFIIFFAETQTEFIYFQF